MSGASGALVAGCGKGSQRGVGKVRRRRVVSFFMPGRGAPLTPPPVSEHTWSMEYSSVVPIKASGGAARKKPSKHLHTAKRTWPETTTTTIHTPTGQKRRGGAVNTRLSKGLRRGREGEDWARVLCGGHMRLNQRRPPPSGGLTSSLESSRRLRSAG